MIEQAKVCLVLLVFLAGLHCQAGATPASGTETGEQDRAAFFQEKILAIDKAMGDDFFGTILFYDSLLGYAPFDALSSDAGLNIDACITFLGASSHTEQQKAIAAHAMHLLTVDDHVAFSRKLIGLFDRKQITYWQFIDWLIPHRPFSQVVIDNFDQPGIRALLTDVATRTDVRVEEKTFIGKILSGEIWANLRAFDVECCSSVPFLERNAPRPPLEFMLLVRMFKWGDDRKDPDQHSWIKETLYQNAPGKNLVAKDYLDILLKPIPDGYSDHDLEAIWRVWNSDFPSMKPGEMRTFLTTIRDEIAAQDDGAQRPPANPGLGLNHL